MVEQDQGKSQKALTRRSLIKGGAAGMVVAAATFAILVVALRFV